MRAKRKQSREPVPQEPHRATVDFAQGRVRYAEQMRRRRNRHYGLIAVWLILGVAIGFAVVLVTNWFPLAKW